jgi:hypothetical protein
MSKARALTPKELRDKVLECWMLIAKDWASTECLPIDPNKTEAELRCEGVVITICTMLDGCYGLFPPFDVVARPRPDEKKFYKGKGQNWIRNGTIINTDCCLHEKLPW